MENADPRAPYGWIPGKENYRAFRHITDCALFHENVRVACRRCGNEKIFSGYALWWLFHKRGWDDALRNAKRRFRCVNCSYEVTNRRRGVVELSLTREEATGPQPPRPDEREWKRLVNRQRS